MNDRASEASVFYVTAGWLAAKWNKKQDEREHGSMVAVFTYVCLP